MKAFANITLGELNDVQNILFGELNAELANDFPESVNWENVAEYFHETFGNEYDDDDTNLVHGMLCISPDFNHIYVLEVQEDENGVEHLAIETINN